jgi:hypothetical protein
LSILSALRFSTKSVGNPRWLPDAYQSRSRLGLKANNLKLTKSPYRVNFLKEYWKWNDDGSLHGICMIWHGKRRACPLYAIARDAGWQGEMLTTRTSRNTEGHSRQRVWETKKAVELEPPKSGSNKRRDDSTRRPGSSGLLPNNPYLLAPVEGAAFSILPIVNWERKAENHSLYSLACTLQLHTVGTSRSLTASTVQGMMAA